MNQKGPPRPSSLTPGSIEFPAVLLNTSNGEIESEFHMYIQPQEHPVLSEFCTELTGITQSQVDEGVPLHICLSQFSKWIQKLQKEKNITFSSGHSSSAAPDGQLCAFVTWSDWDLGVCLHYECKRKQLRKPDILNSWIDLRATYKLFYSRKPQGLNGALQDVGIIFAGREHSGLDDSRNTARLAWRMIRDGCVMKITKSLDKVPPAKNSVARLLSTKPPDGSPLGREDGAKPACLNESRNGDVAIEIKNNEENQQQDFTPVAPLHGKTHILSRNHPKTDVYRRIQSCLTSHTGKLDSPLGYFQSSYSNPFGLHNKLDNGHLISNSLDQNPGLVLVSTTLSSVNNSDIDISTTPDCYAMLADWEDAALIQGSQDDQSSSLQLKVEPNDRSSLIAGVKMDMINSTAMTLGSKNVAEATLDVELSKAVNYKIPNHSTDRTANECSNASVFKFPVAQVNTSSTGISKRDHPTCSSEMPKRKPSSPKSVPPAKKPAFTVFEEKSVSNYSLLFGSCLHNIPSGILNSSVNVNQSLRPAGNRRVTPPLCKCGRRARRLNVSNGGPNHGKAFYSCPVGKQEGNRKGCGYFKWEDTFLKEKFPPPTSHALGLPPPVTSCNSSRNSQRKCLSLRPSMRT
uniref:ERI1 exoribonuclease 2 n=1 Tax=Varanus komodoensis TaxID=61221 RepID=A0A8D2J7L1_VARKO